MNLNLKLIVSSLPQTFSMLQTFFLAMSLEPEVQRKAQAELDRVVSADRLPDYGDLDKLPYIKAIVMETMRKTPVAPLSVPHSVKEDDEYEGWIVPKGSVVVANIW